MAVQHRNPIQIFCMLMLLLSTAVRGQPVEQASQAPLGERPRIGVVLSGGAARGGAHIGVLKALEELRVPIDYITGTSIGAAIGGFYASGMNIQELEEFVAGVDWDAAFLNATPRQLHSFRRKRDDDLFLVQQKPGFNDGEIDLPVGLVQGQVIDLIMSRVTLPVASIDDFDELAIPFRAVATDLIEGEAIILSSGDLGRSLRASMTVPAALAPVEINGRMLVDGGITMNLPVEIAKNMGANRIIAVDISDGLKTREELQSVVDVTTQLTNILIRSGTEQQLALLSASDILLTPEFTDEFSSVSFVRMSEAIQPGYDAVMAEREQFAALALEPAAYQAYRSSLVDPRSQQPPNVDFIRLDNDSIIANSIIENRLSDIVVGEPLDVDVLERAINRVYGLELYQNVRYAVIEEDGQTGLNIELDKRGWGPNYLQLGVEFSSQSDEDALFGLAASYLRTEINDLGGEWRASIVLGDEPGFLADFHQPLGHNAMFFAAPSLKFESTLLSVFDADTVPSKVSLRETTLEIATGRELASWGEIRVGLRGGFGEAKLRVGDPVFVPNEDFRRGEFFTRFSVDTFDDMGFPRSGVLASAEWRGSRENALSADEDFDQVLVNAAYAKTWGRYTLLSTLRYDATTSGQAPTNRLFRLGGFFDLAGLNPGQLSGQHVARLGASYYRQIGDLALFPAFAGVSVQVGNAWERRDDIGLSNAKYGGSLWAGVDTPIGPIYVGYGLAEGGDSAFYVFLGRIF